MQKLIAKYGLAAHLALMAVAPLFLFPFFDAGQVARVLLWLSLAAALWTVLGPSVRSGETLHAARRRVFLSIRRDPFFWALIVLIVLAGGQALNSGVSMIYDAETSKWIVSSAVLPWLPGSVDHAGLLPFATMVAVSVVIMGCRHSLGRSARMAYLLVTSVLAGLASVLTILSLSFGAGGCRSFLEADRLGYSFAGLACGLHLVGGTVAVVAAFERKWNLVMPLFAFAIGGTAAGAFAFSPAYLSAGVALLEFLVLAYAFVFACRHFRSAGEFKMLVVVGISFVLGGVLTVSFLPPDALDGRIAAFLKADFFPDDLFRLRAILSGIAVKSWLGHLWIGTGIGSFPLDFRFAASADDWVLIPRGAVAVPNGWLNLLAERGIVGVLSVILPVGFLLSTYVRHSLVLVKAFELPHPACLLAPIVLVLFVLTAFFDCSFLRPDVLLAVGGFFAIAANSFPMRKAGNHG